MSAELGIGATARAAELDSAIEGSGLRDGAAADSGFGVAQENWRTPCAVSPDACSIRLSRDLQDIPPADVIEGRHLPPLRAMTPRRLSLAAGALLVLALLVVGLIQLAS